LAAAQRGHARDGFKRFIALEFTRKQRESGIYNVSAGCSAK